MSGIPDSSSAKRLRVRSENYLLQDFSVDLLANAKIYTGTRARLDYLFSKATFDKPLTIEFDNASLFQLKIEKVKEKLCKRQGECFSAGKGSQKSVTSWYVSLEEKDSSDGPNMIMRIDDETIDKGLAQAELVHIHADKSISGRKAVDFALKIGGFFELELVLHDDAHKPFPSFLQENKGQPKNWYFRLLNPFLGRKTWYEEFFGFKVVSFDAVRKFKTGDLFQQNADEYQNSCAIARNFPLQALVEALPLEERGRLSAISDAYRKEDEKPHESFGQLVEMVFAATKNDGEKAWEDLYWLSFNLLYPSGLVMSLSGNGIEPFQNALYTVYYTRVFSANLGVSKLLD